MSISLDILKTAVHIKEQIAELEARLEKMLGSAYSTVVAVVSPAKKGRRKMSAAARAKIGAAQKLRWQKQKGTSVAPAKAPKKQRKLSAAGRARIFAAQKKRWASKVK